MSRKLSDTISRPKAGSGPKIQGVFVCKCCPKKFKEFDTQEQLKYVTFKRCILILTYCLVHIS